MTPELLQTIIITVAVLLIGIPILRLVRTGKITRLSASKDGGLQLDMATVDKRDESRYFMDRRIAELDEDLRVRARTVTHALRRPILRAMSGAELCTPAVRAIASDIRSPMFQATEENDFKHKLALASRSTYLADKLALMSDEYNDLITATSADACSVAGTIKFPEWPTIEGQIDRALRDWSDKICAIVIDTCERKIAVYQEYKPQFEAAQDTRFVEIVTNCISKNQEYIRNLGGIV